MISRDGARVKVMVVPTNEELVIAEDTARIVQELKKSSNYKMTIRKLE